MSQEPPPYAPGPPQPGLYPSIPPQQQQQPPPGGYYPVQPQPVAVGPTAPPGQTVVTYYPPSTEPQQYPQQLVVAQPVPVVVAETEPVKSYVAHIVMSCCVFWCCGCVVGLVAFICAGK